MTKHKQPNLSVLWDNGHKPPCPGREQFTSDPEKFMCEKCGHKFKKHSLERIDGKWRMVSDAEDLESKKGRN